MKCSDDVTKKYIRKCLKLWCHESEQQDMPADIILVAGAVFHSLRTKCLDVIGHVTNLETHTGHIQLSHPRC